MWPSVGVKVERRCRYVFDFIEADAYQRIFGKGRVYIWCIVSWVIGTVISAPAFHPCCKQLFRVNFTTWQWALHTWGGNMMSYFDMAATGTVSPFASFSSY